jgi:hypothetical protein
MIFNKSKKIKVGYYISSSPTVPNFLFQELSKSVGCPATKSLSNRIYGYKPLVNVDIEFGLDSDGIPFYNYEFDTNKFHEGDNVHNVINDMLHVIKVKDKCVLQVSSYLSLVTDNKDLEITLLEPLDKTYKDCEFVSGAFYPYGWIRLLNASYIQTTEKYGYVTLNVEKDIFRIFTNKPIDLKEIEPTKKILKYASNMYNIAGYLKNLNNNYKYILRKRPKRMI